MRNGRTQISIAYDVLRDHANEWVSANALVAAGVGWRYGSCIHDLRGRGHIIDSRRDPEGSAVWQYRLVVANPAVGQVRMPWGEE